MASFRSKIKWWHILLTIIVLAFIPFPTEMIPEWKLQVIDEKDQPIANVNVEQSWENYAFSSKGYDSRRSDGNGIVIFPRRFLWSGAFSRIVSPGLAELGKLAHGSSGLIVSARIYDQKYHSRSDDMIFWYSEQNRGEPLPEKIIATKG